MAVLIGMGVAKELALETSKGEAIPNHRSNEISYFESNSHKGLEQYTGETTFRSAATPTYNCHGMTFASRRTCIYKSPVIYNILSDDEYVTIKKENVLEGDVIVYFSKDGDAEHSGIVIERPKESTYGMAKIISKWGKAGEMIHYANVGPYDCSNIIYYRMKNEDPIIV